MRKWNRFTVTGFAVAVALGALFGQRPAAASGSVADASSDSTSPARDFFVRFRPGVSAERRAAVLRRGGLRLVWTSHLVPGLVRAIPARAIAGRGIDRRAFGSVAADPAVAYLEENHRIRRRLRPREFESRLAPRSYAFRTGVSAALPTDPLLLKQWALVGDFGLHPASAWAKTTGAAGVRVAVLDTGVDTVHVELAPHLVPGYDFIDSTDRVTDHHGHGTHVSGVIGAVWDNREGIAGLNRDVTLIPIRVVPTDGDETDADLVEGFEFAVQQGARIANCSFGKLESSRAVGDVIEAAGRKGLFVVVAAGNDGVDNNDFHHYPASFRTPNMIVVAASTLRGNLASFSNYGLGQVDLAAPGTAILSTLPGGRYEAWDGTSMATPQVVGVAALVLAIHPGLSPVELREVLLRSVDVRDSMKGLIDTGGILNAAKAVENAQKLRGFPVRGRSAVPKPEISLNGPRFLPVGGSRFQLRADSAI